MTNPFRLACAVCCSMVWTCGALLWAGEGVGNIYAMAPAGTLATAHAMRLDALDDRVRPLAEKFGFAFPAIEHLVAGFDGVDAGAPAMFGLAQLDTSTFLPFVLLPVSDYKAFVRSGDGDAGVEVTPLTLGGEELLASHRGTWALVTSVTDRYNELRFLDSNTAQQLNGLVGSELLTLMVTQKGLEASKTLALSRPESSRQLSNRRRVLASRPMDWKSLTAWVDRVTLHRAMVTRIANKCNAVAFAVDVGDDLQLKTRTVLVPRGTSKASKRPESLRLVTLSNERIVATAECPWESPWVVLMVQLYLDGFSNGSDEVGVDYFRPDDFARFRESVLKVSKRVLGAQFIMTAPADNSPKMSNSALLLTVNDAEAFVTSVDDLVVNWNLMIERARRRIDFLYETSAIKAGDLAGKRYSIDLPTAFRNENVPEVRKVMTRLYGRNGAWAVDVVPIGKKQVLISDLPDSLRDEILLQLHPTDAGKTSTPEGWTVTIDPAVLQDWLNDVKRESFGEEVLGWKPKPLASTSKVLVKAATHASTLTITADLPADVVEAVGELVSGD